MPGEMRATDCKGIFIFCLVNNLLDHKTQRFRLLISLEEMFPCQRSARSDVLC